MNLYLRKQNGQVDAPFELLVAIVIMGFVILAGTYAISNLSKNTCLGDKRQDMSELVSSLRDAVLGSDLTFRNISLTTKACFNSRYETIKLQSYDNQQKCSAVCGGGSSCLLLEYIYDNTSKNIMTQPIQPICTNLPSTVIFAESGTHDIECGIGEEGSNSGWMIINPTTQAITSGKYRIFRTGIGSNSIICFLKKV
jgi:hypothetical protein